MCSDLKYALITTVGILAIIAIFGIIVCMN
ncbi:MULTISPECIES: YnhF family membrane protein [unclassified Gilliamella]|nr:YnhF family membrane protein [Gilliamella sp. Lep-s35]MWP68681.1 YnhF family membrane protein [Gilliamella sp. Lep-s5]MWP76651.1 YnhF family membrane protein [Gilliamella sp. Lep-s21]